MSDVYSAYACDCSCHGEFEIFHSIACCNGECDVCHYNILDMNSHSQNCSGDVGIFASMKKYMNNHEPRT